MATGFGIYAGDRKRLPVSHGCSPLCEFFMPASDCRFGFGLEIGSFWVNAWKAKANK
jgi:hypothetical protein